MSKTSMTSDTKYLLETLDLSKLPTNSEIKEYMKSIPSSIMLIHHYKDNDVCVDDTNDTNTNNTNNEYIMFYSMTLDTCLGWCSNSPISVSKDGSYETTFENFNYKRLIDEKNNYANVDVGTWCNIINSRLRDEEILDSDYAIEVTGIMFSKSYDRLMSVSKVALFVYYYNSFRILGLSFNAYSNVIECDSRGIKINTELITDHLLERMTNEFERAISDIVIKNM